MNLSYTPSEDELRWFVSMLVQQGRIRPDQAGYTLASMMGLTPAMPANPAQEEYISDSRMDINSGNVEYNRAMPSTVYKCAVVGHAKFGAGGGGHSVDFDIKDGVQISLVGQGPQISVELEQPQDPASPTTVVVAASIGVGTRASRAFNTRTLPPTAVAPTLSLFAKVPKFAYSFLPFCDDPTALDPGATSIQSWGYAGDSEYRTVAAGSRDGRAPSHALRR